MVLVAASAARAAAPAGEIPLEKHRRTYGFEFQGYQVQAGEKIFLFGARQKRYFTERFYWGEAGYGALFGKRSGYIEGGFLLGWERVGERFTADLRLFAGAGGGGSAPQGGGFIVHPSVGAGVRLGRHWSVGADLGYARFLNGRISSPSLSVNLNYTFWSLKARPPEDEE